MLIAETGQSKEALELLKMLCQLIQAATSDTSLDYGITLEQMGTICLYMKDLNQAKDYYEQALEIYERHFDTEPEQLTEKRRELAMLLQITQIFKQ